MERMKYYNKSAFTVVELIVTIVVLGILSTIWFIGYTGYIWWSRDSSRLTQVAKITESLNVFQARKTLPLPDDYVSVTAEGKTIWYQGYVWENILKLISYVGGGKDPWDDTFFTYYLTQDKRSFQILTFLEESGGLETHIPNFLWVSQTHAWDYSNRYPKVYGKKLWVLTEAITNIPIQELSTIVSVGSLDIVTTSDSYSAHITDTSTITGTGVILVALKNLSLVGGIVPKSCKSLLEIKSRLANKDGFFVINPSGNDAFWVYCDMTTDGGWWTRIDYEQNLLHRNHFGGILDERKWLDTSFSLSLTDTRIQDIQKVSREWKQVYHGTCDGVIHYNNEGDYDNAFGFRFLNGQETLFWQQSYGTTDIVISQDGCGDNNNNSGDTIFKITDIRVPIVNISSSDNGGGESFWSELINNPAWLR